MRTAGLLGEIEILRVWEHGLRVSVSKPFFQRFFFILQNTTKRKGISLVLVLLYNRSISLCIWRGEGF